MADVLGLSRAAGFRLEGSADAKTGQIINQKGESLAKETIVKYTASQAYVVLTDLESSIAGKTIKVAPKEEDLHLKLGSIENAEVEKENRRLMPIAAQFHSVPEARLAECHLSDLLAEHTLGRFNLELKKNVTIDSFVLNDSWRDDAGFIVTDRNTYQQVTFGSAKLLKTLQPASGVTIVPYKPEDFDGLADFDNSACGFSRDAYLEVLAAKSAILVAKSGAIDGYIAAKGTQIYCLYAETMELAHALLKAYIEQNKLKEVILFTKTGVWECEPESSRPVHRRHTRAVPSQIKWPKIYALNMGVHIV
ncbi:unnamed protein product [Caenorhabditis auriculariae]|uniref:DUF7596 domain-containing protein n=1 Tax=Caenorhabditis auriculariae TaxID=2777116 RepID=A0A8S1HG10_9PELO|nr:unnamed protein product [Caenorhabditis auriculariae]